MYTLVENFFLSLRQVCDKKWRVLQQPRFPFLRRFLSHQPRDFVIQSRNNFRKPFDPSSEPQAFRQPHFNPILVSEQALSKGAVESFNDRLVPVNLRAPTPNVCFVSFHFFGDSAHEFSARAYLKQLWPFQRTSFVISLKSARNLSRVFRGQQFSFFEMAGNINNG